MRPLLRWSIVALALVAGASFMLSVVAGGWWSVGGIEIGPHGSRHCYGGAEHCGLNWVNAGEQWQRYGTGTWAAGLMASFGLIVIAACAAAKKFPKVIAKLTLVAIATSLVVGILFFTGFPSMAGAAIGRGLLLFGIGISFGVAASITALRAQR